ncbi:hypothetical protein ACIRF8_12585 [Streptomyces sp. NPDC102406]|uniref:hypothetical protein n=1 Tax=Streptomyces sp. NPDC102406 TaxID=3366171 RepID=UPI0037FECC24
MSEQTTPVRTDELRQGDRVWHPFDLVCFTIAHEPRPETGLHFEGEPGLRVTGTTDRGETVHVDVAPAYEWHRGPKAAKETNAPLVVNTTDGTCWTRRMSTRGGLALYALAEVPTCPDVVMATYEELAEHGIAGTADALPMPVGPAPQGDPVAAGRGLDLLALMNERAASVVSPVLAGVLAEAERLRARVAELESRFLPKLCKCGHTGLFHTVAAPHSCFAGKCRGAEPCDCGSYRQLSFAEAERRVAARHAAESADRLTTLLVPTRVLRAGETGGAS